MSSLLEPFLPDTAQKIKQIFGNGVIDATHLPLFPKIYVHTADPRQSVGTVDATN
jgi:hypothetical protein